MRLPSYCSGNIEQTTEHVDAQEDERNSYADEKDRIADDCVANVRKPSHDRGKNATNVGQEGCKSVGHRFHVNSFLGLFAEQREDDLENNGYGNKP